MTLLARTTRGSSLTEAGTIFREYAARICAEMDLAHDALSPHGELRGRLRIAVPISFGASHMAPVLAELAKRHPQLHVQASYRDERVDLIAGGFDAAIRVGPHMADSTLLARRVGSYSSSIVASPEYLEKQGCPQVPEDLLEHEVLMNGTETWRFRVDGKSVVVHPRGRFNADSGAALVIAAVAGIGIAKLPDVLLVEHLESGALRRILTEYPRPAGGIYIVRPPGAHPSRKLHVLTALLGEYLGGRGAL